MDDIAQKPKISLGKKIFYTTILSGLAAAFIIGDVSSYMQTGSEQKVAQVGSKVITIKMLSEEYERLRQNFQGMPAFWLASQNLPQKALQNLIEKMVFSEYAAQQGIVASKTELAKLINDLSFLKDVTTNQFSKEKYFDFLGRIGLSESEFLAMLNDDIVRDIILKNLVTPISMPHYMLEILQNHAFEQREINFITAPTIKEVPLLKDDESTLKAYYEKHQKAFSRPETRDVSYVIFSPSSLKKIVPTQADIQAYYQKNMASYGTPEKRHIYQISFDTQEQAKEQLDLLKKGEAFVDVAKKMGKNQDDIDLGILEKAELSDKVADKIFALQDKNFSDIFATEFGYAIYYIHNIKAQSVQPLAEVAESIKATLARDAFMRFKDENLEIIEDDIAGGATLAEIAKKYNLDIIHFKNLNALGELYNTSEMVITNPELVNHLFALNKGDDADLFDIGDDTLVMAQVDNIEQQRGQTFAEARNQLIAHDKNAKIAIAYQEQAKKISSMIQSGDSLHKIAEILGVSVQNLTLKRAETVADLSPELVDMLFKHTRKDGIIYDKNADTQEPITYAMVNKIDIAPISDEERAAFREKMQTNASFETYQILQKKLQANLGTNISQKAYMQWLESLPQMQGE